MGLEALLILVGLRGHTPRSSLLRNQAERRIYPFRSQMAKVELEEVVSEVGSPVVLGHGFVSSSDGSVVSWTVVDA